MKDQFDEMGEKLFAAALSARPVWVKKKRSPTASEIIGAALREAYGGKGPCESCGRREGSTIDRGGYNDADGSTLGPMEKCETCGRWACPECLGSDCCSMEDSPRIGDEP